MYNQNVDRVPDLSELAIYQAVLYQIYLEQVEPITEQCK